MDTPASGDQPASSPGPSRTCPHCGAVLPVDAPEGQCPACLLLNLTLEPTAAASPTQPVEPPKPPAPPLTPEELAPHFPQLEILECLGRGGMGVVYKARQKALNRPVALKLLAPEREKDAAFAERFTREAQALAVLSHPHIVTIYDFGITASQAGGAGDGFYYLLMEYVDGVNLRHLLDQRKLTAKEALAIVPQLCDALQFAHERGIVHRDIKPENLLLDKRGQVKIADFGIAKMLGNGIPSYTMGGTPVETAPAPLGVTQPETGLGTPAYMAPEQASAPERVDSRADIYSLGVVFYEMLTGELPARQLDAAGARMRNLHIDVRLDEIVLRALEKKPEMRWQTAADLRTRIEEVSSAEPPPVAAVSPPTPEASAAAAAHLPFHPWMQRFVARSVGSRRALLWCLLISGGLLTVCFMMPVSKHRAHPALIVPVEQQYLLISKDEWIVKGEFGLPDAWWSETVRQGTVPTVNADGKSVGRTAAGGPQIERSVDLFTWSYAMGLAAAIIWIVLWYCLSAEQRAGDRLPADQRAFAAPLVDRSRGARIRWGRILIILLAFLGTTVVLSAHMSAIMMLVLGDAPGPVFNAVFTTFFLSFVLIKGLARELAGEPPASGPARAEATAMPYARACGPTAAGAGTVMAFAAPFLVYGLNEAFAGRVKDRFLISVFLVTWGVSISVAHWLLSRRKLSEVATRRWLRATSIAGWILFLPVGALAIFFLYGLAQDSGWNPAPAEAIIVPIICLGALMLPLAAWHLWCVSGLHPRRDGPPRRSAGRVVLGIFLVLAAIGLPVVTVGFQFIGMANAQAVYQQKRSVLQQVTLVGQAHLDELQQIHRDLLAELGRTEDPGKKSDLSRRMDDSSKAMAAAQRSLEQANRSLRELTAPPPGYEVPSLAILITGSAICLAVALMLFRVPKAGDGYRRIVFPALSLLAAMYVVIMLGRALHFGLPVLNPGVGVDIPYAYNYTVRDNVLLVTLTMQVRNGEVEAAAVLHGAVLRPEAGDLASQSYRGQKVLPGQSQAQQPRKTLPSGRSEWQIAFAFPNAALALAAGNNLRPLGMLAPRPGRTMSTTLFQVESQEHGMYQGEIQFSIRGMQDSTPRVIPVPVEVSPTPSRPKMAPQSIAIASEEEVDVERLGKSLVLWRAERENLAKIYLPTHPKMKELDARIEATQTVIKALSEHEKSRAPAASATPPPAAGPAPAGHSATAPPVMDTSDAALRALDWKTFDQTPGQYRRKLTEARRFREAAILIERYLALHPELDKMELQIHGASLHFRAAQCYAFAGEKEKAYAHLAQSRHPGAEEKDGLLWNSYVDGTEAFLREDRTALITAHAKLIRGSALNKSILFVLDRLLAKLGMPYEDAYGGDTYADHVKLSADSFNRAWELLDKPQRTPEEDAKMLAYSHASLVHWRLRTDVVPRNVSIAYWQLSRIYAVLGQGKNAMTYAGLCWMVSKDLPNDEKAFYGGYANEAMARAARVLGDGQMYYISMNNLKSIIRGVQDPSQREQLEKDMKELETNAPPMPAREGRKEATPGVPVPPPQ